MKTEKEKAKEVISKQSTGMLKKANVVGIGYGKGEGDKADRNVIRIYVTEKKPREELSSQDVAPRKLGNIEVDIIETKGEIKAQGFFDFLNFFKKKPKKRSIDRKARHRPIPGGVSIGNISITAGTKGHEVIALDWGSSGDLDDIDKEIKENMSAELEVGKRYLLSNAHVFCEDPQADVSKQERRVIQQGKADGGTMGTINYVGQLMSHVVISPNRTNYIDCAVVKCDDELNYNSSIVDIGVPNGVELAAKGMSVKKSGRTTGYTEGTVEDDSATIKVNYGSFSATFADQLVIRGKSGVDFSAGGDSGSLILNDKNNAVGLLFAGSGEITIANKIERVLKPLGVKLVVDEESPPNPEDIQVRFIVEKEQSGNGRNITCTVIYKSDILIDGAMITVSQDGTFIESKLTDNSGVCRFLSIESGVYTISFDKDGYVPQSKTVEVI